MRYQWLVSGFCLLAAGVQIFAQNAAPIVTLKEESTTGKYFDSIPAAGPAIIDINSTIHINIDVQALENEMFRFQGIAGSDERLKMLNTFNTLLKSENEILEIVNRKFSGSSKPVLADFQELATESNLFLKNIQKHLDKALLDELESDDTAQKFLDFEGPYIIFVIRFLEEKAQNLRDSLLLNLKVDGQTDSSLMVYFRLGAFLKNKSGGRPVHVEHFDEISPDAYSEIARFSPPISEPEKKALSETMQLNENLQGNLTQATDFFKQAVKARINNLFPSDSSRLKLKKIYSSSLVALNGSPETQPAAQVLLENELDLGRVDRFYSLAAETYQQFAGNFPGDLLKGDHFDQTFDDLEQLVINAFQKFKGDVESYQTNAGAPGLSQLITVENSYDQYVTAAKQDISGIKTLFLNIRNLLDPFRKSYLENEDLTEKVSRFTAGKIPPTGLIELKYIGERKAGDEILIKAVIERGRNRSNPNFEQKELFRRYVGIARVAAHVKMSGSVILANPYNREKNNIALTNRYQFTPNYGIFLKWGSRKSKFYNDFLSFGLGLGFSSPDFNLDGTPEFGAGMMATAFRDLFSLGWGWNFGVDAPYFFMGFNIPFAVGGLQSAAPETGFLEN